MYIHMVYSYDYFSSTMAYCYMQVTNRVAFIGISNWALDPAKMNRGIMVTRSDPDVHELVTSAR